MDKLPINEIFNSIQGEGGLVGMPMTFVRLQGCDIGCSWCDTKQSWKVSIATKYFCIQEILKRCDMEWICITGGEPAQYDLSELTKLLKQSDKKISIETSGCYPVQGVFDWITISPKFCGKKQYLSTNTALASEFKFPIGKQSDLILIKNFIQNEQIDKSKILLQPISQSQSATKLCIDAVKQYQWRLSLQTHKFTNIR